jgi:hypothetical protein
MDLDIIHPDRGNIADADPVGALVKRRKQSKVRPGVKQLRIHRIFAHNFYRIIYREIAGNRLPRFAEVSRAQDRGAIVA